MATPKGRNNNPEGHNEHDRVMAGIRGSSLGTAAVVGGALVAGLFLWSRRNQVSDQIGGLGDQINEWRESMRSENGLTSDGAGSARTDDADDPADDENKRGSRTQSEIAEEALTLKEIGETA